MRYVLISEIVLIGRDEVSVEGKTEFQAPPELLVRHKQVENRLHRMEGRLCDVRFICSCFEREVR